MSTQNSNKWSVWCGGLPVGLLSAAVIGLAGCQTEGYKKSDAAAWNSDVAAKEVKAEKLQIEATMSALNDLVNQPTADAKPQFLKFDASLDRLVTTTRRSEREMSRMWSKRAEYFAVWAKEIPTIQDPATRGVSESRRVAVSNQFDVASSSYDDAHHNVQPLLAYLQDIRKALSTDLTRDGLQAIKPSVASANEKAHQVQEALSQSAAELDTLGSRTASYRVQDVK